MGQPNNLWLYQFCLQKWATHPFPPVFFPTFGEPDRWGLPPLQKRSQNLPARAAPLLAIPSHASQWRRRLSSRQCWQNVPNTDFSISVPSRGTQLVGGKMTPMGMHREDICKSSSSYNQSDHWKTCIILGVYNDIWYANMYRHIKCG